MPDNPLEGGGGWVEDPGGEGALRPLPPGLRETVPDSVQPNEHDRQTAEVEAAEAGAGRVEDDAPEPTIIQNIITTAGNTSAAPGNVLIELPAEAAKTAVMGLENQAKLHLAEAAKPGAHAKLAEIDKTRANRLNEAAVQIRAVLLRDDLS